MVNIAALITGASAVSKSVVSHPLSKGGGLAALITGGLYVAAAAGVVIPEIAYTVGPVAGFILYKLLPKSIEDQIDQTAQKVVDLDNLIPEVKTYDDYPADKETGIVTGNIPSKE
jgi:hypothetical protein